MGGCTENEKQCTQELISSGSGRVLFKALMGVNNDGEFRTEVIRMENVLSWVTLIVTQMQEPSVNDIIITIVLLLQRLLQSQFPFVFANKCSDLKLSSHVNLP